jgi:sugar lactone lactonase YvrE
MRATVGFLVLAIGAVACRPANQSAAPVKAATVGGFLAPESVKWDSAQDIYFVSNINGNPGAKDNNGYISVVGPAGMVRDSAFVGGGKNGVTLNAPKGMAIVGDTLWVADIDAVRGFNARTGAPVATVTVPAAVFLNDIAVGPDGALYITDTGLRITATGMEHPGPDRIYRIAPSKDRAVSVAVEGHMLAGPNGIAWDKNRGQFIVVQIAGPDILAWKPGAAGPTIIAKGPGGFDGVEIVGTDYWVSTWADSSVYRFRDSTGVRVIKGVPGPADIGYDAKRNRIIIPLLMGNTIEIWQLQ